MCGNGHEGGQTARGKELGATAITQEGVIVAWLGTVEKGGKKAWS